MSARTPPGLRALGRNEPPVRLTLVGGDHQRVATFKHDFFAATALYNGPSGRVVVKFGRRADFLGLPLGWLGRWLTGHEANLYRNLNGLPGIPAFVDQPARDIFAHVYIEGHALGRREPVPDDFFSQLDAIVHELHRRQIAYVDLEKPENVLVGDDGRPYLVDFQIAWCWPAKHGGDWWPLRWVRRKLQQGDLYHLLKLRRRCRPDLLTPEQWHRLHRKPWLVRLHRVLTEPLQRLRRSTLKRLDPSRKVGERGRAADDADARGQGPSGSGVAMPLSDHDRGTIQEFRQWIEEQFKNDPRFRSAERLDRPDDSTLATRFLSAEHVWFEVSLRPFVPQLRAGILTDDRWKSEELEEAIEETGDTMVEFVEQGLSDAGLDWPEPPVEHYRDQGKFFYFATPFELGSLADLARPEVRQRAKWMVEGYCHAFGHKVIARHHLPR